MSLGRYRFLATFIAGRPLQILPAAEAYTDGRSIYVPESPADEQRRMIMFQAALLRAGSLRFPLRGQVARRYLAIEGLRAWALLGERLPLQASAPLTRSADESLRLARSKTQVADPPAWFGVIKAARIAVEGVQAREVPSQTTELGEEAAGAESKLLKLFENPLVISDALSDFLRNLFGTQRGRGDVSGAEVRAGTRANSAGPNARPLPTKLSVTVGGKPGMAAGVGGALYPEWDVHEGKYRPEWCRVLEFPLRTAADVAAAGIAHDAPLRRSLSKVGLGPKVLRRRADGDELDLEALIELYVDLRAGHSPPERVYSERRKTARNLGVLILVDASGSANDQDAQGLHVHDHQRRAAATLALTLEELGDRVAVYGFRSQGRANVHVMAIKPFSERFHAGGRARLNQLRPDGYTRLGASIRHAGEVLKRESGTTHRLLLVLSDGFPYDDGYEARYAEADARRSLEELRADGTACLCLSIGSSTSPDALQRVFGAASHANAPRLADLSPRMDALFLSALKELAAPNVHDPRRARPTRR